jgi:hypothetical protein
MLSAYRKGDFIRMLNGETFTLTSEAYYCENKKIVVCNTDRPDGSVIPYSELINDGFVLANHREYVDDCNLNDTTPR